MKFRDLIINREVKDFWEDICAIEELKDDADNYLKVNENYRIAHSELTSLTPRNNNYMIHIDKCEIDGEFFCYAIDKNAHSYEPETYDISFEKWEDVLGMEVEPYMLQRWSEELIIAIVYREVTDEGFHSEDVLKARAEIKRLSGVPAETLTWCDTT